MSFSRRNFLKYGMFTGATVALTACQRNVEHDLVSQYQMPEYKLPGQALYWATSCGECSGGCGVAVKTTDGRAIKVDGIPEHPISRGKICARGQSALQVAYHPDRAEVITSKDGKGAEWAAVFEEVLKKDKIEANSIFVTRTLKGSLGGLMVELAKEVGAKIWVVDFPGRWAERQVMKSLTGKAELPHYPLEESDVVVTFGGDLLSLGHNIVSSGWSYGQFRQGHDRDRGTLISVSSRINMTAANSDRWLAVRPGSEGWVALAVGNLLAAQGKKGWPTWAQAVTLSKVSEVTGLSEEHIKALAARLGSAKKPLVIADSDAGNYCNGVDSLYIIHALQKLLTGSIATFEPENVLNVKGGVPKGLVINTEQAMALLGGEVGSMWVFDVDLLRILPQSLHANLEKPATRINFASFRNQTSGICNYTIPIYNWLEDFGDQRLSGAAGEVYNLQQPAITSVWKDARSLGDILMAVKNGEMISLGVVTDAATEGAATGKTFRDWIRGDRKMEEWETLLARGGAWAPGNLNWEHYPNRVKAPPVPLADSSKLPVGVSAYENIEAASVTSWNEGVVSGMVLMPFATLALRDGSLGNRPWMQELPDPITTIVWGSWVELNSEFAKKEKINRHDLVQVELENGQKIVAPAFPLPSLHPDAIAIPVGDDTADYSKWSDPRYVDFGLGNKVFGRYGYTNANYGKKGVNPLKSVEAKMTAGEPHWAGSKVKSVTKLGKTEMVTAMDMRLFNLEREIIPFQ